MSDGGCGGAGVVGEGIWVWGESDIKHFGVFYSFPGGKIFQWKRKLGRYSDQKVKKIKCEYINSANISTVHRSSDWKQALECEDKYKDQ